MKDALELFKFHVDGKFFLVCVLLSVDGKCSQGAFARYVENLAKVHAYTTGCRRLGLTWYVLAK